MVYELIHQIDINNTRINKVVSVSITKNVSSFTNTSIITIPKRLKLSNDDLFGDFDSFVFKKGQIVSISLGYRQGVNEKYTKSFTGFISNIKMNDNTVDIECEDFMFFMKKTKFNFSSNSITLKSLGQKIVSQVNSLLPNGVDQIKVETNGIGLTLANLKIEKCTGVEILDLLKKNYTLESFFIDNTLNIGINYAISTRKESNVHTFSMYPRSLTKLYTNENLLFIIDKSGLNYQKSEDIKVKVTAKVFTSNSTFYEKSFGDSDGEERTFVFNGKYSDSELSDLVQNQIQRLKYEGFQRGSTFTTFGQPYIQPLDIVSFDGVGYVRWFDSNTKKSSKVNVYNKSSYLVESVTTTFNNSGYRQSIGIAQKISIDADSNSISSKIESGTVNI